MRYIALQTGHEDPSLCLANIRRLGKDFGCRLQLKSGPFSADYDFYFEGYALDQFIAALGEMEVTLRGEAVLKPMFEDYFLKLQLDQTGHVKVSGELFVYSDNVQKLTFAFQTDQTCLGPFIKSLQRVKQDLQ